VLDEVVAAEADMIDDASEEQSIRDELWRRFCACVLVSVLAEAGAEMQASIARAAERRVGDGPYRPDCGRQNAQKSYQPRRLALRLLFVARQDQLVATLSATRNKAMQLFAPQVNAPPQRQQRERR
jgi:hypothetical protein